MLGEYLQSILLSRKRTERIVYGTEGAVSFGFQLGFLSVLPEGDVDLHRIVFPLKIEIGDFDAAVQIQILRSEDFKDFVGLQLLVLVVGNLFADIAEMLPHLGRQIVAEGLLQKVADAALSGLGIHPDHIGVVGAADVLRVDGNVGHIPFMQIVFASVFHALCNGVLVRAGEGGEH